MLYKNFELYNFQDMINVEGCDQPKLCRVPSSVRQKLNPLAQIVAFGAAGCEIRFTLHGEMAKIKLNVLNTNELETGHRMAEVYHGCFLDSSPRIVGEHVDEIIIKRPENIGLLRKITEKHALSYDADLIRVVLPYDAHFYVDSIEGDISIPLASQSPEKKYLAYGSSITHGSCASHPTGSYVMKVASRLGVDAINLGLAGSAMVDAPMADYIATRTDWDFATLELGINALFDISVNKPVPVQEFKERVDYFVSKIAESHPDKWIFCTDVFLYFTDLEPEKNDYGNLLKFREIVREKVESIDMPKVKYISGLYLLSSASGLSSDMIHPAEKGMEEIAQKLTNEIRKYI